MDIKARITEFWQATRSKFGDFYNNVSDSFRKVTSRFRRDEAPAGDAAEAVSAEQPATVSEAPGAATPLQKTGGIVKGIFVWLYRLRRFFMAAPVIWYAVKLARYNQQNLPEEVGLILQTTGEYAKMVSRADAVYGPLWITIACLLLMFFSRKARFPWIISIFTLVLPILILVTNLYPQ